MTALVAALWLAIGAPARAQDSDKLDGLAKDPARSEATFDGSRAVAKGGAASPLNASVPGPAAGRPLPAPAAAPAAPKALDTHSSGDGTGGAILGGVLGGAFGLLVGGMLIWGFTKPPRPIPMWLMILIAALVVALAIYIGQDVGRAVATHKGG
jgi:hypothetical protein